MKIVAIFAPYLFAFRFPKESLDEYKLALDQWTDVEYLKKFYEDNFSFIRSNEHFPVRDVQEFVEFISNNADAFDNNLSDASTMGTLAECFDVFSKGNDIYEILPHKKSKFQVLRLYGIQLGNVIIISGSAIKLTKTMDEQPLTKREKIKIRSLQDFLRDNEINDEESFFDYLSQQD